MYSYVCGQCGVEVESAIFAGIGKTHPDSSCPLCGGLLWRAASSPAVLRTGFDTHFNVAVGKEVHSDREFRSELSRLSDERSEQLGMDHKFVPVDLNDRAACGATDEGLDKTAKMRRDTGLDSSSRTIII